jgi:pectate lyase
MPRVPLRITAVIVAALALVAAFVTVTGSTASAATLFSDDFEDGNSSGWTTSGGSWSVITDGSRVFRQSGTSSDARARAGTSTWTDYAVTARVRPTAFNGSNRFVAVLARAQSNTSYYYLALRQNNTVELKKLVGGSSTTLASAPVTVTLGTWYTLRLEVSGTQLRGNVNGGTVLAATDSQFRSGQIGVATFNASASFDNVVVETVGSGTPSSPSTQPSSSSSSSPPVDPGPNVADGWASVNAWGQNGTTGGAGGPTVTVTSAAQFLSEIAAAGPRVIRVNGMLSLPGPMHDVASDKTIVGVGANSGLSGGGLNIGIAIDDDITAPPANAVHNVIVRNLRIVNSPDDGINVQMFSHHVWLDHNYFTGASDGSLDVKRGSSYVTVSWNHFDGTDKTDNWFDATEQRNPRVRFGDQVHVYNNYYNDTGNYGVASTMDAGVIVEGNYFLNVEDPYHLGEGSSGPGRLVARNNCLVNSEAGQSGGSVSNPPYSYTVQTACSVNGIVSAGAGTGKVGLPG